MLQGWILEHVRRHPPRCISGFVAVWNSNAARAVLRDEDGCTPRVVAFELRHRNRGEQPTVLGHYLDRAWPDDCAPYFHGRILVSPLLVRWAPSGQVMQLFDSHTDGYNAEIGCPYSHERSRNGLEVWRHPPECRSPVYVARFGYCICDDEELFDEARDRPQDFFDVFSLAVYCRVSGRVWYVTEFECA